MSFRPDCRMEPRGERELRGVRAEAERHERRWRTLIHSAPGPVILFRDGGRILEWNAAAEQAFGWTAEQARNLSVQDVLMTGERHERTRVEDVRRCDGTVIRAEVTIVPDDDPTIRLLFVRVPAG